MPLNEPVGPAVGPAELVELDNGYGAELEIPPVGEGIGPVPELEIVPVMGVVEGRTLPVPAVPVGALLVPFERGKGAVLTGAPEEDPTGVVKNGIVDEPVPGGTPVGAGCEVLLLNGYGAELPDSGRFVDIPPDGEEPTGLADVPMLPVGPCVTVEFDNGKGAPLVGDVKPGPVKLEPPEPVGEAVVVALVSG